jgi:hypothetical protein
LPTAGSSGQRGRSGPYRGWRAYPADGGLLLQEESAPIDETVQLLTGLLPIVDG